MNAGRQLIPQKFSVRGYNNSLVFRNHHLKPGIFKEFRTPSKTNPCAITYYKLLSTPLRLLIHLNFDPIRPRTPHHKMPRNMLRPLLMPLPAPRLHPMRQLAKATIEKEPMRRAQGIIVRVPACFFVVHHTVDYEDFIEVETEVAEVWRVCGERTVAIEEVEGVGVFEGFVVAPVVVGGEG
jgi:hypothetical protein